MHIHHLNRSTCGGYCSLAKHKLVGMGGRSLGTGLKKEVYEGAGVKCSDTLANLKLGKPKIPHKYISF